MTRCPRRLVMALFWIPLTSLGLVLPAHAAGDVELIGVEGPAAPATPLQASVKRFTEKTVTFLQGVPPGSFAEMDAAETSLIREINAHVRSDPGSTLATRIGGLLWLRSQLLWSFASNWRDNPADPAANDQSRKHLIEALDVHDVLTSLTGTSSLPRSSVPARFGLPPAP